MGGWFEIEQLAAAGGMGAVWRAVDRRTGARVALKMLMDAEPSHARRFLREATLLSELSHPSIVGHVGHGTDLAGRPWLAMRWLEGEDLAARLTRGPLDVASTVILGARMCEALAVLHAHGVVHRDIKPHNVFLEGGRVDAAVLIDLGVARAFERRSRLTSTNDVVGTVGYLAPEQIEEVEPLTEAVDVFSLGCVLYECVTGQAAFAGAHPLTVLARVLLVEPTPIDEARSGVPPPLAELIHRMLAKPPADRPRRMEDVREALDRVDARQPPSPTSAGRPAERVGAAELRVTTFVISEPRPSLLDGGPGALERERARAERIAAAGGARLSWSVEGVGFAVLDRGETPGDRAARGCRLALELAQLPGTLRVVVSTGRVEHLYLLPTRPLNERAASKARGADGPEGAFLDADTEALLGGEVVLAGAAPWRRIVGVGIARLPRTILGRVLPCLGRARELSTLDSAWSAVREEHRARVVTVTGPAGVGKTRLVLEWLGRLRDVTVVRVAVDPVQTGSLQLLAEIVRAAASLGGWASHGHPDDGSARALEPGRPSHAAASAESALASHAASLGLTDHRVVAFLMELAGVTPVDRAPSAAVRAARSDPRVQAEWLERAFLAWMGQVSARPLVLVLEDLAWADEASVTWLDRALSRYADHPWLVVGTSRPTLHDRFPHLWEGCPQHQIALGRLPVSAAQSLVEIAAGETLDGPTRAAVVERANGHPFLLEELVRHAVEDGGGSLPDSVLAMVQLRLDRLRADLRRVLRLASVFGERFVEADLASLAGAELRSDLAALERAEVIGPEAQPGRWSFRHALVREAAYESMPTEDRRQAHEAVVAILRQRGEPPEVLARHFEAAGLRGEAAGALVAAARRALESGVPKVALELADRAAPLAEDCVVRARAWAYASGAASMIGDLSRASTLGDQAMGELAPDSEEWFMAAYGPCLASYQLDTSRVPAVTRALLSTPPAAVPPTILSSYAFSACILVLYGVSATRPIAQQVVQAARQVAEAHGFEAEPFFRPLQTVLAVVELREGDVAEGRKHALGALTWCRAIGADGLTHVAQVFAALAAIEVGCGEDLLEELERARAELTARENHQMAHFCLAVEHRALAASRGQGHRAALDVVAEAPTPYHAGWYTTQRATFLAATGRIADARALVAPYLAGPFPLFDGFARCVSGRAALAEARFDEALEHVLAFDALAAEGQVYPMERSWMEVVRVAALSGLGRLEEANAALDAAVGRLGALAARLDLEDRDAFETAIEPNRAVLAKRRRV